LGGQFGVLRWWNWLKGPEGEEVQHEAGVSIDTWSISLVFNPYRKILTIARQRLAETEMPCSKLDTRGNSLHPICQAKTNVRETKLPEKRKGEKEK
jgi:hypothetical protein